MLAAAVQSSVEMPLLYVVHTSLLGRVGAVGDQGVDEQLVSVPSCDVQRRVPVIIFTVNVSTYIGGKQ